MAKVTATQNGSVQRANTSPVTGPVAGKGDAYSTKTLASTEEIVGTTTASQTVLLGEVPSSARLSGGHLYWDTVTTQAVTLDIGLAGPDTTADPDAINDGVGFSIAGNTLLVKDAADIGKPFWSIAGESADPGGYLQVYATLIDAARLTTDAGTLSMEMRYYLD